MRVPPDQSGAVSDTPASATSMSRARNARVTLVSRVPNKNVSTRRRSSVSRCRKCRKMRV